MVLCWVVTVNVWAAPRPQGTTTCSGTSCNYVDVPLGVEPKQSATLVTPEKTAKNATSTALNEPSPPQPSPTKPKTHRRPLSAEKRISTVAIANGILTNLPVYYQGVDRTHFEASESVVFVPKSANPKIEGLTSGDVLHAVIEQSLKASPSVPTPLRALITSGKFKGGYLVGEATLERELKRILLTFTKLRTQARVVYTVQATGLSPSGQVGLEGEYHTETGKFFIAELAAATAAGIADSTISRQQTPFGGYVQEPSLSNSAKQGAVTALSRTADRIAEKVRSAPEWTEVPGYQEIQIIIQDEPTERG